MNKQKLFFYILWVFLLAIGPITVLSLTPFSVIKADKYTFVHFLQRIVGLLAFTMLFVQIILGAFMERLIEKFGGWIFKFHVFEGAIIYSLVLTHPLTFVILNYFAKGKIDPFYVFTDVCVICRNNLELYYTFGRTAFWLISAAVLAAVLRKQPWLTRYWHRIHILNYLVFFLVAIHSYFIGTDSHFPPFVYFWWFAVAVVTAISLYKLCSHFSPRRTVSN